MVMLSFDYDSSLVEVDIDRNKCSNPSAYLSIDPSIYLSGVRSQGQQIKQRAPKLTIIKTLLARYIFIWKICFEKKESVSVFLSR